MLNLSIHARSVCLYGAITKIYIKDIIQLKNHYQDINSCYNILLSFISGSDQLPIQINTRPLVRFASFYRSNHKIFRKGMVIQTQGMVIYTHGMVIQTQGMEIHTQGNDLQQDQTECAHEYLSSVSLKLQSLPIHIRIIYSERSDTSECCITANHLEIMLPKYYTPSEKFSKSSLT